MKTRRHDLMAKRAHDDFVRLTPERKLEVLNRIKHQLQVLQIEEMTREVMGGRFTK